MYLLTKTKNLPANKNVDHPILGKFGTAPFAWQKQMTRDTNHLKTDSAVF